MTATEIILQTNKAWNTPNIVNRLSETEAYVEVVDGIAYASFSPTRSLQDVQTDCLAFYWSGVHTGFMQAFTSIEDELEAWVDSLQGITKVRFCGHSLGGALALVAMERFAKELTLCGIVVECWTTGAPKPFRGRRANAFHNEFGKDIHRYELAGDFVPLLPPWGKSIGDNTPMGKWGLKEIIGLKMDNHIPSNYMVDDLLT